MTTRRAFTKYISAVAALSVWPGRHALAHAEGQLEAIQLREGVWHLNGGGGNTIIVGTGDAMVLIDTKVAAVAMELEDQLATLKARPAIVVNTHHHGDHVGSNFIFKAVRKIAQSNLEPRLAETIESRIKPGIRQQVQTLRAAGDEVQAERLDAHLKALTVGAFKPDRAVDSEWTFKRNDLEMRLLHFGDGHTDNDLVVHFPRLNIVHTGDLCFHKCFTYIDRGAKATTRGWQKSVGEIIKLCDDKTMVVPGHGSITDVSGLHEQVRYFDVLRDAVREARKAGQPREAMKTLRPPMVEDYEFPQLRPVTFDAIWEELEAGD